MDKSCPYRLKNITSHVDMVSKQRNSIFDVVHLSEVASATGHGYVGPARSFCFLNSTSFEHPACTDWPLNTELGHKYVELVVTIATLAGANIKCGTDEDARWTQSPWYHDDSIGKMMFAASAYEVAERFLAQHGRWLAYNTTTKEWELISP